MAKKQTAGRDQLGEFAPKFAELNDDVLFGQVWAREKELSLRDRSFLTVTALITKGAFEQLPYHMQTAKANGITKAEIAEMIIPNSPFTLVGQILGPLLTLPKRFGATTSCSLIGAHPYG